MLNHLIPDVFIYTDHYKGRDAGAYRRDVLSRTLGMLRHAGLWRPAALTEIDEA